MKDPRDGGNRPGARPTLMRSADMTERTCDMDGCERKHCARGLCKTHYNRKYGKKPTTRVQCHHCGTEFAARNDEVARGKGKYCSQICYHAAEETREAKTARRTTWPTCKIKDCGHCGKAFATHGRAMARRTYCSLTCAREAQAVKAGWRNRSCLDCDASLGYHNFATYCDDCRDHRHKDTRRAHRKTPSGKRSRAEARRRRRARLRGARVERVYLDYLLTRDKWTCGICHLAIPKTAVHPHPLSPTLDHIIPLVDDGEHSKANCQPAHYICNSLKGANGSQQLALIG